MVVIGGGLAGLTAGATAAAGGASTVVLEAHEPGGRARVVEREGFRLNMGGHALYLAGPGRGVLRSLGIDPTGAPPPLDRYKVLLDGEQHVLPSGPASLMRTTALGRRSKAQFAALLAKVPLLRPDHLAGTSVTDWLAGQDLRPDTEAVLRALVRISTYVGDHDHLSADAAVAQLQAAAKKGVVYVHGGWSQLIDALAARVDVRTGVKVTGLDPSASGVTVHTAAGDLAARQVVVAAGTPAAAQALLPHTAGDPAWAGQGEPVTAACLDVGARRVPDPGYVLSADEPLYVTTQSPPADQAPPGQAVVAVLRYGARSAAEDRPQLERHLAEGGVRPDDVVVSRFLARMVVAGSTPNPANGGLRGRTPVTGAGLRGVHLAGDWVGPVGMLADASLASGQAAARLALRELGGSSRMVA